MPVALYAAVQWFFSVANVRRLMTWESKLLRRTFAVRPWPGTTYAFYIQRVTKSIRSMFYRFGHASIMQSWIFRLQYAATIFRPHGDNAADRLLAKVAAWRDTGWWAQTRCLMEATDQENRTGWRHHPLLRNRGVVWDQHLHKPFGDEVFQLRYQFHKYN